MRRGWLIALVLKWSDIRRNGDGAAHDCFRAGGRPLLISITKLLHAVELPILLVAIFKYNSLNFDKRLSSTIYLVGFACTNSVIGTVLSPLAGFSYERFGFAQSYLIMGIMVFSTTFISIFLCAQLNPHLSHLFCSKSCVMY